MGVSIVKNNSDYASYDLLNIHSGQELYLILHSLLLFYLFTMPCNNYCYLDESCNIFEDMHAGCALDTWFEQVNFVY